MRRKRSARKRKMRKKTLYQAASLISIAAFGIAQVTPTSHAVFSHSVTIKDGGITTSFVFPETIEGLVNEIKAEMEKVATAREQADTIYGKLEQAESSEQAISDNNLVEILDTVKVSQEIANDKMNQLNIYLAQAQLEIIDDESVMNILKVIEEGTQSATELMDSMVIMINEIEEMSNQANVIITVMVQAETAALEKEMIAEIAKKALEGLTNADTGAAELLTKYGTDFDLNAFQALTEELAKSEGDLQKALEDAENYMNELKVYVDGTKEVASPEVLEEAKANYEKVQQAIDSLKETMENTKTTNTEVQTKIEQEKQRMEEEAQKIEEERIRQEEEDKKAQQELENQSAPAAGGGAANPQTPVEEEKPIPESPTVGEEPTNDLPLPGGGGGGTPNTDQPPVEGEIPSPEQPQEEKQPVPDQPPVVDEKPVPDDQLEEGEKPNPDQPPVTGEEQNPETSPVEGEETDQPQEEKQPDSNQSPVEGGTQNPDQSPVPEETPVTPPSEGSGHGQNDQSDDVIDNQPARTDDEDSQSGNEDDTNSDSSSNDDDQPETEQNSDTDQNNQTEMDSPDINNSETNGTKEDDTKPEVVVSEDPTTTEVVTDEEETQTTEAVTNEEETQTTETSTTSDDSDSNRSDNEIESSDDSTNASESIERDTVASMNAIKKGQDIYSFDSIVLNRREEDNEFDLFDETGETFSKDVQNDIITLDNDHKVKINIRTYLSSKRNKKL